MDDMRDMLIDILLHKPNKLTFEQLADYLLSDKEIYRAFELLKAEKEGKLILPPCKVGDTVYDIYGNAIAVQGMAHRCIYKAAHYIEDTIRGYPFFDRKTLLYPIEFSGRDIGKTVFLTREEAEKALREKENG